MISYCNSYSEFQLLLIINTQNYAYYAGIKLNAIAYRNYAGIIGTNQLRHVIESIKISHMGALLIHKKQRIVTHQH